MRFLTLFVEKIVKHPQIKDVPGDTKKANKAKLLEVMTITENLKRKLFDRFEKEYDQYLIDQEKERKRAVEEAKRKVICATFIYRESYSTIFYFLGA
jgi:STAM-binding protein